MRDPCFRHFDSSGEESGFAIEAFGVPLRMQEDARHAYADCVAHCRIEELSSDALAALIGQDRHATDLPGWSSRDVPMANPIRIQRDEVIVPSSSSPSHSRSFGTPCSSMNTRARIAAEFSHVRRPIDFDGVDRHQETVWRGLRQPA